MATKENQVTSDTVICKASALPPVTIGHRKAIVSLLMAHVPKEHERAGGKAIVTLATVQKAEAALLADACQFPMIAKTLSALKAEGTSLYKMACKARDERQVFRTVADYDAFMESAGADEESVKSIESRMA